MKMDIVASSKNDEFYTPKYAIEPILTILRILPIIVGESILITDNNLYIDASNVAPSLLL